MALLDVLSLRVFEYFTRSEPRVKPATHEGIQEASEEYVTAVPRKHSPGVTDAVGALPTSKKQDSATAPVVHEHESNSIKKTDNAVEDTSSTEVWAKFEEIVPSELKDLIVVRWREVCLLSDGLIDAARR